MIDSYYDPEFERIDEINEDLKLIQKKNGLLFGSDAYFLSAYVEGSRDSVACELGCGTGVASFLLLTKKKACFVHAFEIQEEFAELTERNAKLNGLSDAINIHNTDVRNVTARDSMGECDIVISNPPYLSTESGARNLYDEKYIARHEVCGGIYDFCLAAKKLLKSGGSFYCVYRPDRLSELFSAMKACSLAPKLITAVHGDIDSRASMVLIKARKDGGESLTVTKPFIIYETKNGTRQMTDDAAKVYETCSFRHIK